MTELQNRTEIPSRSYAAIFVDFENVFYFLQNQYAPLPDLTEYTLELLRNLRTHLQELECDPIVSYAYADFERLSAAPQGSLYLMGIETVYVLGTEHKNAADMRLCIDAMQVLYTRPDIKTFVLVAGDRDYIPVIQHIQKQGRTIKAVAFRGNLSGDLLQNIGEENFIDALTLFNPNSLKKLQTDATYTREAERIKQEVRDREAEEKKAAVETPVPLPVKKVALTTAFKSTVTLEKASLRECLALLLREYGSHPEIWLSPFLRRLTDAMPTLADYERKNIVYDLEEHGAIRVEVRKGKPFDYRVIIINYNHPDVRELNPGG